SSATSRLSSVPTKILPFHAATRRLTTPQQTFTAPSRGTCGSERHSCSPVAASNPKTLLHEELTYMTPSTTIGVASWPRLSGMSAYHARPRPPTFLLLISVSGL